MLARLHAFNHGFLGFSALYLLVFLFTRLSYFLYYDIPGFNRDTFGYYEPVIKLLAGELPLFDFRTPGYPLLLLVCRLLNMGVRDVFIVQSLFTLGCFVFCQYLVNRSLTAYRWVFLLVSLAFFASGQYLSFDTSITPFTLFTGFALCAAVLLVAAAVSGKTTHYLLASLSIAALILIRPQGFFVIPAAAGLLGFLAYRKSWRRMLALLVPGGLLMLSLLMYNKATFGKLAYGNFRTFIALGSAMFFLDTEGDYSDSTRVLIMKVQNSFTDTEKQLLRHSWSFRKLSPIYNTTHFDKEYWFMDIYKNNRDEFEKLTAESKRKNFTGYLKFIYVNFVNSFLNGVSDYFFYYNELVNRKYYIEQSEEFTFLPLPDSVYRQTFGEYTDLIQKRKPVEKRGIITADNNYTDHFSREKWVIRLNHYYQILFAKVFSSVAWVILYFVALAIVLVELVRSRFKNYEAWLLLIPGSMPLLNNLLISLSVIPLLRYVYPTEIFIVLFPLCLMQYFLHGRLRLQSKQP
ncbi:MAG: hypothetical protein KatS3mg031_0943 [Chitinophagales bacterium]|nr:MAG: hypothetical protein KatS3mg031_0943 [Chitinophagales bacterium]